MKQRFDHRDSPRAQTKVDITFQKLYAIVWRKVIYFDRNTCDPDAFCQGMCVEIEKEMGIYPNVEGLKKDGQ